MKIFTFSCGPLKATVSADDLRAAKQRLRELVCREGLDERHLADDQGLSVCLGLVPVHINDDHHWSC